MKRLQGLLQQHEALTDMRSVADAMNELIKLNPDAFEGAVEEYTSQGGSAGVEDYAKKFDALLAFLQQYGYQRSMHPGAFSVAAAQAREEA